ncbi:MAG: DUF1905 domain-containing protein [Novosphingobium sp.]|nr:DUF1905 domain-containing protein [Novosphingobium sp.]
MSGLRLHPPASIGEQVAFEGPLWRWTGGNSGAWFFLTISGDVAEHIATHALMRRLELGKARGFGSVKVMAKTGSSRWSTSVFPNGDGTWILPFKAAIRRAEDLAEGDSVPIELSLL